MDSQAKRLAQLDAALALENCDGIISTRAEHIRYLADHQSFLIDQRHLVAAVVYAPGARPRLLAPVPEAMRLIDIGRDDRVEIVPYGGYLLFDSGGEAGDLGRYFRERVPDPRPSFDDALAGALADSGLPRGSRIEFDALGLAQRTRSSLDTALRSAGVEVKPGAAALERARMVKTRDETDRLARAAAITEAAFSAVIAASQVGTTERQMAQIFAEEVHARGASVSHWSGTIGAERGWTVADPGDTAARPGDVVRLDGGATVHGYRSDIGCTMLVGDGRSEIEQLHRQLEAGFEAAVTALVPGTSAASVFDAAVTAVQGAGLDWYERGDVGHGIGLDAYELPLLRPAGRPAGLFDAEADDFALEAGMVLCLELPCPVVGLGGFQLERMYEITDRGARRLGTLEIGLKYAGADRTTVASDSPAAASAEASTITGAGP